LARGGGAPLLPGNESRIVRHGTAQQTVVLAKSTKLKHGTKLRRTLCYYTNYYDHFRGRGRLESPGPTWNLAWQVFTA